MSVLPSHNNKTRGGLGEPGSVQPECTVPLSTWNFRIFKPEFLLNVKRPGNLLVTWDQAQFLFRFANNIPAGKAKRKEILAVAVLENVWEPLKLGLISGYTPGWRETKWSKVPCLRKQRDGRGLNPGPPDPEFEVLTTRPHSPPNGTTIYHR